MNPGELQGRVSFVTGASRGIGRGIALALSARGSDLVLAGRRRDDLEQVAAECEKQGVRCRALPMDLMDAPSIATWVSEALKAFGRVDHLVNNAGITADGLLLRMKREDWDRVLTVNLTGVSDAQQITVTLSTVTDCFGSVLPNTMVTAGMLIGDTTGNGAVNSGDVAQTKARSGQPVSAANFRSDVNTDGSIDASDVSVVKSNVGTGLP